MMRTLKIFNSWEILTTQSKPMTMLYNGDIVEPRYFELSGKTKNGGSKLNSGISRRNRLRIIVV